MTIKLLTKMGSSKEVSTLEIYIGVAKLGDLPM